MLHNNIVTKNQPTTLTHKDERGKSLGWLLLYLSGNYLTAPFIASDPIFANGCHAVIDQFLFAIPVIDLLQCFLTCGVKRRFFRIFLFNDNACFLILDLYTDVAVTIAGLGI